MGFDLFETLLGDAVRDLGELPSSGLASQLAVATIVILGLAETGWFATQRHGSDRSRLLREAATAAAMGFGGLIVGVALAGLFVLQFGFVSDLAPGYASQLWADNRVLGFVAAFVAWDLVGHLYHRIGHGTALGWAAHRPHHTGEDFTFSLAWRQSWLPVHAVVLPLVAVGGWPLSTIIICASISNVIQALQHTSLRVHYPRLLVAICMTPVQHRRHHQYRTASGGQTTAALNLGPVFTVWDRLGGTYLAEPVGPNESYGVRSTETNPIRLQSEGWVQLARRTLGSTR